MHRLLIALLLGSLTAASAAVASERAAPPVDPQEISRAFFRTVFGLEYGNHVDAQRVKRYVEPVRFYVADLSARKRGPDAAAFLEGLPGRIGHLDAAVVGEAADANFRVILVDEAQFAAVVERELKADVLAMNARCLVGVSTLEGRIVRSTAVIVADDDFLFARCLVEEVLQGLGPMNDDESLPRSVFNDTSRHAHFTAFDEALMNVLYHPLIRPGMSGSEAHRTVPKVLHDLGYTR
jgi:catechol 2,3-dioxygenase-like lactoylglutathione lyase family enzyme